MTNYSGIVNKQDASDHGAAVIYGNGKNESAVDNYLDTIAVKAKAKKAENKALEQDAARANVNVLSQIDKAWSPHSQYIHKQYEDWQKLQKQALQTRNPKEKYDLQAKADLQRANIITTVSHSEEQKKVAEAEKLDQIKNFDNWDEEDITAHNNYVGRTDVDPFNEPYIPSGRKMQDRLLNDLKKVKISPTYTVENKKEKVEGKDYDAYYENATITQEQIDSGYNTFMSTPSSIKAKARFIATRTQQSIPYANAEKEWEQNIKSQILANSGGGEQVVGANGKVSYVNRKKKGNVSEWGPSSTFNFGGDGNGAVNKSGTIVMSVQPKADGSEDISLSNTGVDGKTADFVAPSTKALIKTIATGITFDPRAKDQVEIVNPTYTISPDRKTITMSATVASTLQQTMIRPEEKKLYTITNVPILKDGDYVGEGKAIWESLNIQQKFNITIDENGVVSKTPNATTRQTVGNKAAPKTAPKTQAAPAGGGQKKAAPAQNVTPKAPTTPVSTNTTSNAVPTSAPKDQKRDWAAEVTLPYERTKGAKDGTGLAQYNNVKSEEVYNHPDVKVVEDLPEPLRVSAGDFGYNSEDPRASLMVAAGVITAEEKAKLYTNGKLDKKKVDEWWDAPYNESLNTGKGDVLAEYNKDPKGFISKFGMEKLRSYANTNDPDGKNYSDPSSAYSKTWKPRVNEINKYIYETYFNDGKPKNSAPAGGGQKKAAPAPAAPAAPGSKPRRQVKVVNGKIVTVVNGKIVP